MFRRQHQYVRPKRVHVACCVHKQTAWCHMHDGVPCATLYCTDACTNPHVLLPTGHAPLSEAGILQLLKNSFTDRLKRKLAASFPLKKRQGPVDPVNDVLECIGSYYPLVGFETVIDDVIRLLCHLCSKFRAGGLAECM